MFRSPKTFLIALALLASVAACSSGSPPGGPEAAPEVGQEAAPGASPGDKKEAPADHKGKGGKNGPKKKPHSPAGDKGDGPGGDEDPQPGEPREQDPATGSAKVLDSTGDAEASGEAPAYTDIIEAAVRGRGRTLLLTVTLRGDVPARMPDDDTFMSVETLVDKGGREYSIYADADDDGWTAYITQRGDSRRLEEVFSFQGRTTAIEIPWGLIGGAGGFRWSANSAWTRTTLTNTYFAFDSAPDGNKARYPGPR
jgi:hypothetical protein